MKTHNLQVIVGSDEELQIPAYAITMSWSEKERSNNPNSPERWTEYFQCPEMDLEEFKRAAAINFDAADFVIHSVEEVMIRTWGL